MCYTNELITVVVPVYQVEKYLQRCIDSIINQTYQNLEIILVDDGSKDNSPFICDNNADTDKRIHVIHKENGGLSSARNAGIEIATGEYIIFIDSDDVIHSGMIEELYHLLKDTDSDIAVCDYKRFRREEELKEIIQPERVTQVYNREEALREIYGSESVKYVVAWNKLYARELFANVRYKVGKLNEDEFTTYKLFAKASRIASTNQIYYYYFNNGSSITTNEKYLTSNDIYEAFEEAITFYNENGYDSVVKAAQKAHLDRLISRCKVYYHMGKDYNGECRVFWSKYKNCYRTYKKNVSGIGYKLFNVSYKWYYVILEMKEGLKPRK